MLTFVRLFYAFHCLKHIVAYFQSWSLCLNIIELMQHKFQTNPDHYYLWVNVEQSCCRPTSGTYRHIHASTQIVQRVKFNPQTEHVRPIYLQLVGNLVHDSLWLQKSCYAPYGWKRQN